MINVTQDYIDNMEASVRQIRGKVELYNGSTVSHTYIDSNDLQSFDIDRVGDGDVCGFVVCQKLTMSIINNSTNVPTVGYQLKPYIGADNEYVAFPKFIINELQRDNITGDIKAIAYDKIKLGDIYTYSDLNLAAPYSISTVINAVANKIGCSGYTFDSTLDLTYSTGANFDGSESLRTVLEAIATATQTVCYINNADILVFKNIRINDSSVYQLTKNDYYNFSYYDNPIKITRVCSTTELGDNVEAHLTQNDGYTYYVRDNPFWNLRTDIGTLVDNALSRVGGLTLTPFEVEWYGLPALEIGDKVALVLKDNSIVYSYILDDVITFDGALKEKSQWRYQKQDDTDGNPSSLGERLNQTYARIDKVRGEITLLASTVDSHSSQIASLVITSGQIESRVSVVEGDITTMQSTITQMPDQIRIAVEADIADDYYAKVSSIDIDSDGIEIKSTGTITIDSGADLVINSGGGFEVHTTNFTIDSSGNVTIKGSISSGSTITGATISGGTINIGNGNFTVSSNGTVSLAGVATFNPETASWYGSSFDKGVDMSYLEIGHINDNNNTPKSNNWAITAGGTGYFQALESQSGNWSIASDGTCTGLKAIAVFGA